MKIATIKRANKLIDQIKARKNALASWQRLSAAPYLELFCKDNKGQYPLQTTNVVAGGVPDPDWKYFVDRQVQRCTQEIARLEKLLEDLKDGDVGAEEGGDPEPQSYLNP